MMTVSERKTGKHIYNLCLVAISIRISVQIQILIHLKNFIFIRSAYQNVNSRVISERYQCEEGT